MDVSAVLAAAQDQIVNGIVPHTVAVVALTTTAWLAVRWLRDLIAGRLFDL